MKRCECNENANPVVPMALDQIAYKPDSLPFLYSGHVAGECKCNTDLKYFIRDGKRILLCEVCVLGTDIPAAE